MLLLFLGGLSRPAAFALAIIRCLPRLLVQATPASCGGESEVKLGVKMLKVTLRLSGAGNREIPDLEPRRPSKLYLQVTFDLYAF